MEGGGSSRKGREGAPDAGADPGKQRSLEPHLELDIPRSPVRKETGQLTLMALPECDFYKEPLTQLPPLFGGLLEPLDGTLETAQGLGLTRYVVWVCEICHGETREEGFPRKNKGSWPI